MIENALTTLQPVSRVPRVPLTDGDLLPLIERLIRADAAHRSAFPGDSCERQPVHVVYGGAHLFKAGTPARLAAIALGITLVQRA